MIKLLLEGLLAGVLLITPVIIGYYWGGEVGTYLGFIVMTAGVVNLIMKNGT